MFFNSLQTANVYKTNMITLVLLLHIATIQDQNESEGGGSECIT